MRGLLFCEKFVCAAEICGWTFKMAGLRPEVSFLLIFKGLNVGEKHAGKICPQKVGVDPSSEADSITGQQGVLRSVS